MLGSQRACASAHLNASWRHHIAKKFGSILLALMLVVSLTPCVAWADESDAALTPTSKEQAAISGSTETGSVSSAGQSVGATSSAPTGTTGTVAAADAGLGATNTTATDGSNTSALASDETPSAGGETGFGIASTQAEPTSVTQANSTTDSAKSQNLRSPDAQVSGAQDTTYELSSVGVESSGQLVQVGNMLTPTPMYMVQSGTWSYELALPDDANVTYTWYAADDATGTNARKLDSANVTTGELVLSASEEGLYVYVEANAGSNTMRSQAYLVESAAAQTLTINAQVVGTTRHQSGEDYSAEAWIPLTEYTWSSDTKTTAWDVFAKLLDKAGYSYSLGGGVPYSITTPDNEYTLATSAVASSYSYWEFYVNGDIANVYADNYVLQNGDTIELKYYDAAGTEQSPDIAVDPDVALPDWTADWSGYGSVDDGSTAITNAETPTENAELFWAFDYSAYGEYGMASASEPVIVNGFVYMAVNKTMLKIDASTGKVLQKAPLAASISYTSRPIYAQGLLVVPLDGGRVQALAADTLTTKWLTSSVSSVAQSSSTLTVRDGRVYVGTVDVTTGENHSSVYSNGTFTCFNLLTGALVWRHTNADEGYYWTGGTLSGEFVIVPTSAGTVEVLDADTGEVKSSVSTGSLVNSDCVLSQDGSRVYLVSADGKLHTYTVNESGKISEKDTALSLGLETSKSTPTVVGSTLIVGGAVEGDHGALAVVDLETRAVRLIITANGAALPAGWGSAGGVKAVPLASEQNGQVYVYFTTNGVEGEYPNYTSGGGVYLYRLGDEEATLLYDADGYHNYCDSPVIADAQGNLYYLNDSNHLIVLKKSASTTPVAPGGQTNPSDTNDNKQPNTTNSNDKSTTTQNTLANMQTVPATHTPLANADKSAASDEEADADGAAKDDEVDTSTKAAAQTSAQARGVTSADANGAANGDAEGANTPAMNVWAVGGLVVGAAGLVCVGIYLARARRQNGDGA